MSQVVPLVSVIVPTHNRVSLLRLTLRSVLWQEGIDLEVLVVDDGSTEDVPTAVKEIGDARVPSASTRNTPGCELRTECWSCRSHGHMGCVC